MEKQPPIKNRQEVIQTINEGIVIYGLGAFGRANLKALQEVCDDLNTRGEITQRKIKVVSERDKSEVISGLREVALKRLKDEKDISKEEIFWWCDNISSIENIEAASLSLFNTRFEIVSKKEVFIDKEISDIQDDMHESTNKIIDGSLHILTCASKQSPHYKKLINEYADHEVIILDGVKGHTEKVELDNEHVKYAAMVGPNYAEEIINRAITAILIASECEETSNKVKNLMNTVPYFKTETFDNPEKLERVGIFKNIGTFAFGVAINYIQDKKRRTDLFVKILRDFTEYAKYTSIDDGDIEKNIEEMTYAFFGDMWMCMLHGPSDLSGKRSRNYVVSREVGEITKKKQEIQKKNKKNWIQWIKNKLNIKTKEKDVILNTLFSEKIVITDPENFIKIIASKNKMPTIEGYQSYKRLKEEGADLEILKFIEAALNGENIENHPYLQLDERDGRADMTEEKFIEIKSKIRNLKEVTMEANCPANTLALVLSEFVKKDILKLKDFDTKKHIFRMMLDVFQEPRGRVGKMAGLPYVGTLLKKIPFVKEDIQKKKNALQENVRKIMAAKD